MVYADCSYLSNLFIKGGKNDATIVGYWIGDGDFLGLGLCLCRPGKVGDGVFFARRNESRGDYGRRGLCGYNWLVQIFLE